ncbi:MAG TPA: aquaporin [Thermoanaerobaculaceae bacterium]|nr:aquaporin [Thermoanaerobaculaceae bacterium]
MSDSGEERDEWRFPWRLFYAEFVCTAMLLLAGLSLVIFMFGKGSPVIWLILNEGWRRRITGFIFGLFGALIALSPLGKESGAHMNPVVTLGFHLVGKLDVKTAGVYVLGQLTGATFGVLPLLAWGAMGRSVAFGATLPGQTWPVRVALLGEIVTTFCLITYLCVFIGIRALRRFTPAGIPVLFAIMSYYEAPISGTSCNPARSLGPAIISGQWHAWWIYWVGPLIGTLVAILVCNALALKVEVAKIYHFDTDRSGLLRRKLKNPQGGT